jgi:hypothetical protein
MMGKFTSLYIPLGLATGMFTTQFGRKISIVYIYSYVPVCTQLYNTYTR